MDNINRFLQRIWNREDTTADDIETHHALPTTLSCPPIPQVKPPKQEKIRRIYEDDDFIIDLFPGEKMVRVSVFDNCHYKDEVIVRKAEYCMEGGVI